VSTHSSAPCLVRKPVTIVECEHGKATSTPNVSVRKEIMRRLNLWMRFIEAVHRPNVAPGRGITLLNTQN